MPAAESQRLRAFREAFEQGNRAWNAGDVKAAYAGLPDDLEYRFMGRYLIIRDTRTNLIVDYLSDVMTIATGVIP